MPKFESVCPCSALASLVALPRRRRKEARPAEMLQAALTLFVEKGFAATRLDDVAALAGVAKGTLYLYCKNKEALFKAVIQESVLPVVAEGEAMQQAHQGEAATLLRQLCWRWWELIGSTQLAGIPKLMMCEAGNFPEVAQFYYENVIQRIHNLLGRVLEAGMAQGEFRPLPLETCVDVLIAGPLMQMIWRFSLGPCQHHAHDPEGFLALHLDLVLGGLRASPPNPVATIS